MVIAVIVASIILFAWAIFSLADNGPCRSALMALVALVLLLGGYVVLRNATTFKVVEERQEIQEVMTGDGGTVQVVFFKSPKDSNTGQRSNGPCLRNVADLIGYVAPKSSVVVRRQAKGGWLNGFYFFDDEPTFSLQNQWEANGAAECPRN